MNIDNFMFTPMELTIAPGTQVTWVNKDDVPHTVVSVEHKFKSKALDTDEIFSFTFQNPGTYEYFCSVHPQNDRQDHREVRRTDMHPFDIREALLAKHAQHVVLIHFPIARLCRGGVRLHRTVDEAPSFAAAAYYNLVVAALSTLPVIATGLLAWPFQLEGQKLRGILLEHLVLGVASGTLICLIWYLHFRSRRLSEQALPFYRLPIEFLAVALVAITGHLGGYLSGVNIPS